MNAPPARPEAGHRLATILVLALLVVAALLAAMLAFYVGPRVEAAFREHGSLLVRQGASTMRALADEHTAATGRVLVDLIRQGSVARQRTLSDLPLEVYGGDVASIRAVIENDDAARSAQKQRNVEVLAHEMQVRSDAHIGAAFAELLETQDRLTAALAADLRRTHLVVVGGTLLVLVFVLGLGLLRLVVRPARALRAATRRIAGGELEADLPPAARGELGDLTRDFAFMTSELRRSRVDLQHLNENLEHEVARKTAELATTHRHLAETERFAALGTLAGGIAHEFHNVIGGIRGCSGELLAEERDPERRETLQVIERAADRAAGIVQQLLRFARRSVEHRGPVDLTAVAADALRLCEPAARRQGIAVERALPATLLVEGDGDGIHQVLVNLLLNAVQAMPDGGTLRVALADQDGAAVITVADTGTGIPADVLPRVFEPFFTTRTGSARPGTGLGLSVSYGIVKAHGGRIEVRSRPGEGAVFTVTLPHRAAGV